MPAPEALGSPRSSGLCLSPKGREGAGPVSGALFPRGAGRGGPRCPPAEQPRPPLPARPAESLAPPAGSSSSSSPGCFPHGSHGSAPAAPRPPRAAAALPGPRRRRAAEPRPAGSCRLSPRLEEGSSSSLSSEVNSQALSLPKGGKKRWEGARDPAAPSLLPGRGVLTGWGKLLASKANVTPRRAGAPSTGAPGSLAGLERGEQRGGALSSRELTAGCGVSSPPQPLCVLPGRDVAVPPDGEAKQGVSGEPCRGVGPRPRPR